MKIVKEVPIKKVPVAELKKWRFTIINPHTGRRRMNVSHETLRKFYHHRVGRTATEQFVEDRRLMSRGLTATRRHFWVRQYDPIGLDLSVPVVIV